MIVLAIHIKLQGYLPCNYGQVSLTSYVYKVLKVLIRDSMLEYMQQYNMIKGTQHGLVLKWPFSTTLFKFLEFVSDHVDQGMPIDVIYSNFSEGF
jgi:hypothetical protein